MQQVLNRKTAQPNRWGWLEFVFWAFSTLSSRRFLPYGPSSIVLDVSEWVVLTLAIRNCQFIGLSHFQEENIFRSRKKGMNRFDQLWPIVFAIVVENCRFFTYIYQCQCDDDDVARVRKFFKPISDENIWGVPTSESTYYGLPCL